jgi:hypothetical protein
MLSLDLSRRARIACLSGLLAGAAALVGCSSSHYNTGPNQSVDQRRQAFPINHDAAAALGYRFDWMGFPAVTGTLPITDLKPYTDFTVALEQGSNLSVLEPNTGQRRCTNQLASPMTRFVGLAREGNLIFAASQGEVFTLDAQTCNLMARQKIEHVVNTAPAIYNNMLIFGTSYGEILAHLWSGSVGGVKAWGFLATGTFEQKPVVIGNTVGAISHNGDVVFLDAQTGSLMGRNHIYAGLSTDPVTDGRLLFVASLDQSIYAFSPDGGSQVWRYRTGAPLRTQPAVAGERLYCDVPGQGLTAFDVGTGNVAWTQKNCHGTVIATAKGRLIVWDGANSNFSLVETGRGDIVNSVTFPNVAMIRPEKFDDGNLYFVSKSGVVAKFIPK